jgi:hypothetical protein
MALGNFGDCHSGSRRGLLLHPRLPEGDHGFTFADSDCYQIAQGKPINFADGDNFAHSLTDRLTQSKRFTGGFTVANNLTNQLIFQN